MFKQILHVQWRATAPVLGFLVLAAFALPLLSIQGAGVADEALRIDRLLTLSRLWMPAYPGLAAAAGGLVGLMSWAWDHRVGHVYALSLPVPRARYALLKMAAGGVLLLVPVAALWIGSLIAASLADVPDVLRAYPNALTLRFLLASAITYATLFTLGSSTLRNVSIVGGGALLLILGSGPLFSLLSQTIAPDLAGFNPGLALLRALLMWPSPYSVLEGNWALIDV